MVMWISCRTSLTDPLLQYYTCVYVILNLVDAGLSCFVSIKSDLFIIVEHSSYEEDDSSDLTHGNGFQSISCYNRITQSNLEELFVMIYIHFAE